MNDSAIEALDETLREFQCVAGTIHLLKDGSGMLELAAQRNIPDVVVEKMSVVPIGKGMAGLAAERRQPVQVCNLQTDTSGVAKPGARETQMAGSIAAPMLASDGTLRGTLGIAKPTPHEFSPEECARLMRRATEIADRLGG
jgi:L-methionine (R)-S-oxide reductase